MTVEDIDIGNHHSDTERVRVLIDAHVHIYDCFPLEMLLDAAYSNFHRQACQLGISDFVGVLCLTETADDNCYRRLAAQVASGHTPSSGAWRFSCLPKEACTLRAQRDAGGTLFIIAGRQMVTAEGLEVLALGSTTTSQDGRPIEEVLKAVRDTGALPVIPWGVGKWLGRRGAIVRHILSSVEPDRLFLGDIAGRPFFWPKGALFRLAEKRGIRVLPGTDPLPLPSEITRPGSCGFLINKSVSVEQPACDLRQLLRQSAVIPQPYGRPEGLIGFIHNQIRIRL